MLGLDMNVLVPNSKANGLAGRIASAIGCGFFVALLGGFVRMTGWLTSIEAMIGVIVLGTFRDVVVGRVEVVAYGMFLGGALVGSVGYAFGRRLEWLIAQVYKDSLLPPASVWDRELDG